MPASEIVVRHASDGRPLRLAEDDSLLASSAGRGWSGFVAERQVLPPTESDGYLDGHLLCLSVAPPPVVHRWVAGREQRRQLAADDVYVIPAGERARAAWDRPNEVVDVLLEPWAGEPPVRLDLRPDPVLAGLLRTVAVALDQPAAAADRLLADGLLEALRGQLARRAGVPAGPAAAHRLTRAELARVDARIQADLMARLGVEDLAAAVPMSPAHFSRLFRATTGETPHAHVVRLRVRRAKELLRAGPAPVADVARRTGFADAAHLARHFRRHVGCSPREYRLALVGR